MKFKTETPLNIIPTIATKSIHPASGATGHNKREIDS